MHWVEEVHTQEVLRTLQVCCQQVDADSRGVRGDDGVFRYLIFQVCQYSLLHFRVFNNSFYHCVYVTEIAVAESRTNAVQRFTHGSRLHFLLLNALGQQLVGFVQAQLDTCFVDVFHHDWGTFQCRLISDTATHDTCAKYRSLVSRLGFLVVVFCFFLQQLVVHEQTDQSVAL